MTGGFRGAYKGILSAALGSAPGAAMFFSTYETMKQAGKTTQNEKNDLVSGAEYTGNKRIASATNGKMEFRNAGLGRTPANLQV